jgi:hypothetical protein
VHAASEFSFMFCCCIAMATVAVMPKVLNHLRVISFGYKTDKETDVFRI